MIIKTKTGSLKRLAPIINHGNSFKGTLSKIMSVLTGIYVCLRCRHINLLFHSMTDDLSIAI